MSYQYLRFIKFRYHVSFLIIIVTAFLYSNFSPIETVMKLLVLYLSFNLFLYTGVYTINDVIDSGHDKLHPLKRKRPIPSGTIKPRAAVIFSILMIAAGCLSGALYFGSKILLYYAAFVAIGIIYSAILKKIPYIEMLGNSITHILRILLALYIFGSPLISWKLALSVFAFMIGLISIRRVVEKDVEGWQARKVLLHYRTKDILLFQTLLLVFIILASTLDDRFTIYLLLIAIYIPSVYGVYLFSSLRKHMRNQLVK